MENRVNRATSLALLASLFGLLIFAMVSAFGLSVDAAPAAEDLSSSSIIVDESEALAGDKVSYTIVLSNTGDAAAFSVEMTSTLPAEMTYVADSLTVDTTNSTEVSKDVSDQVLEWNGIVGAGSEAQLQIEAMITDTVAPGTILTNTTLVSDGTLTYTLIATTTVVSETDSFLYLPIVSLPYETPELSVGDLSHDTGDFYKWTFSWTSPASGGSYIIEESLTEDFAEILSTETASGLSTTISRANSTTPVRYFRVQYDNNGVKSPYSNVVRVVGAYADGFSSEDSGWKKVRQDFDDTENVISYTNADYLKMHVRGRWDYFISSSLQPTPAGNYQLESRIKFDGAGNLNTYGFIFGADWNGEECPTFIANPYPARSVEDTQEITLDPNELEESPLAEPTSANRNEIAIDNCFNHYYRIILLWKGSSNRYDLQVKRIDSHEAEKNAGRGVDLVTWNAVKIDDQNGWNTWRVEVERDTGNFRLYSNGEEVASWNDRTYIDDVYWGFWASTDEYPGSDPLFEYVTIKPLD